MRAPTDAHGTVFAPQLPPAKLIFILQLSKLMGCELDVTTITTRPSTCCQETLGKKTRLSFLAFLFISAFSSSLVKYSAEI